MYKKLSSKFLAQRLGIQEKHFNTLVCQYNSVKKEKHEDQTVKKTEIIERNQDQVQTCKKTEKMEINQDQDKEKNPDQEIIDSIFREDKGVLLSSLNKFTELEDKKHLWTSVSKKFYSNRGIVVLKSDHFAKGMLFLYIYIHIFYICGIF